jgi:hypothetical protein
MLDQSSKGELSIKDIKESYNETSNMKLKFRGAKFDRPSLNELLCSLSPSSSRSHSSKHVGYEADNINWNQFLEYYHCLSLGIAKDEFFEFIIRSSWSISSSGSSVGEVLCRDVASPATTASASSFDDTASNFSSPGRSMFASSFSSSGSGSPSNSSSFNNSHRLNSPKLIERRLVVIHKDRSQETVKIVDELGKTKLDEESLRKELSSLGITDIQKIIF